MTVQRIRRSISITKRSVYMNTGQASPSPQRILRRIRAVLEQEARIGPGSLSGLALPDELDAAARRSASEIIGADPEDLQITHSTREGISVVLYGTSWRPRDELLICDLEHSSLTNPAAVLSERFGVKVVRARVDPLLQPGQMFDAVTSAFTGRTRLVALSHVQYGCGLRMPVKELARFAHRHGVPLFIDGAQSVGQIEVNVSDLECDFFAFSGQKWLMGPVGTGALYVRQNSGNQLRPLFYLERPGSAGSVVRRGLARFSVVSNNPALVAGFIEAIKIVGEIGIRNIERRAAHLARLLRSLLGEIAAVEVLSPTAPETGTGIVTIGVQGWHPNELVVSLQERFSIIARAVTEPMGTRFCTAYFNTEEEVAKVAEVVSRLAKERADGRNKKRGHRGEKNSMRIKV